MSLISAMEKRHLTVAYVKCFQKLNTISRIEISGKNLIRFT